jgi:hypothetical protein
MGWDAKKRGGKYFYQSTREGETVRKEYLGRGAKAEEAAKQAEAKRAEAAAQRLALNAEQEKLAAAERPAGSFSRMIDRLIEANLLARGFHKHKGEWRQKRHDSSNHG